MLFLSIGHTVQPSLMWGDYTRTEEQQGSLGAQTEDGYHCIYPHCLEQYLGQ